MFVHRIGGSNNQRLEPPQLCFEWPIEVESVITSIVFPESDDFLCAACWDGHVFMFERYTDRSHEESRGVILGTYYPDARRGVQTTSTLSFPARACWIGTCLIVANERSHGWLVVDARTGQRDVVAEEDLRKAHPQQCCELITVWHGESPVLLSCDKSGRLRAMRKLA